MRGERQNIFDDFLGKDLHCTSPWFCSSGQFIMFCSAKDFGNVIYYHTERGALRTQIYATVRLVDN